MNVLVYLAAHSERVVSKEELMEAVWSGAFVEEGALSQAIHSLRKVLGDDARQPRYIQTIPKRGYRLVTAVAFKMPEQGSHSDTEIIERPVSQPPPRSRSWIIGQWWLPASLLVLTILGVMVLGLAWRHSQAGMQRGKEPKSSPAGGIRIVVLPFENLGRAEDAFFADGLTEEITKDLASLPSLQVISRTSAMQYRQAHKPLPEIGRELGVDYALEGTVRWNYGNAAQPRVRITPQLIRVSDDVQVWTDVFERRVEDIFAVQAEISQRVTSPLGIALVPEERKASRPPMTENLEAYRAYLRGLDLKNQPFYSEPHLREAVSMFERAVKLDPKFALAWAELSQAESYLVFNTDPSPLRFNNAQQALSRATALAPDSLSVALAQAYFAYRCQGDFDAAYEKLSTVSRLNPNNAEVLQALGFVLRRKGRIAEAIVPLQHAFSLDPRTVKLIWAIAETYRALREFERADGYYAQAISLAPDQETYWEERTLNRLSWTGSIEESRKILADAPMAENVSFTPILFKLDFYQRNYTRALSRLHGVDLSGLQHPEPSEVAALAVIARRRLGDVRGALGAAELNRVTLESEVARFPRDSFYRAYWALSLAELGREADAVAQIDRTVREHRLDEFTGPRIVELKALILATLGYRQEAVNSLASLTRRSYQAPISRFDLQLNPAWDRLRDDRAFRELFSRAQH